MEAEATGATAPCARSGTGAGVAEGVGGLDTGVGGGGMAPLGGPYCRMGRKTG